MAQHQIARLEQLLERVRRNAAAPRVQTLASTETSGRLLTTPPLEPMEPMELSDDDLIAVVSDTPPEPDAATAQAVATAETLLRRPSPAPKQVEMEVGSVRDPSEPARPPGPIAMHDLPPILTWPPERGRVDIDPTLRPPEPKPAPARLEPLPISLVSELPSESSWRPSAPEQVAAEPQSLESSPPAEEFVDGEESGIEVPVLTPPPESGHQLLPESPRPWATTPSQSPGTLELVDDEEEEVEAESVPPSGRKVTESYSLPPGAEQFVQEVELEEDLGEDLELDELPEPPRVSTTLLSPPSTPVGEDLAEPGVSEAHVVEGRAVEVTRRPDVPSGTKPAAYVGVRQDFAPRTFLELLDASLKLGVRK